MKEKLCYVGYDVEQEQKLALETTVLVESYTVSAFIILYKNLFKEPTNGAHTCPLCKNFKVGMIILYFVLNNFLSAQNRVIKMYIKLN